MDDTTDPQRAYTIAIEQEPDPDDLRAIERGLEARNLRHAPPDDYRALTITLRQDDGALAGGLLGETYWGWLHVRILWLDERARGQGYGSRLLAMAEQEAVRRGCQHAHPDTTGFQAAPFYARHGYAAFGVLHDLPLGHSRHFMQKALRSP